MKSKLLLLPFIFAGCSFVQAQENLVPNPGFETLKQTPCGYFSTHDMERYVDDWHQGCGSSADVVSTKQNTGCATKPTQTPHGGESMAHLICGTGTSWVEYVSATLTQPLVPGQRYYAEAYVLLKKEADNATNNLGFYFATGPCVPSSMNWRTEEPQVSSTGFITNKAEWTKISGYFTATAAYTTVTFGNFITSKTQFSVVPGNTSPDRYNCRYYVDDIVVRSAVTLTATGDSLVRAGGTATLLAKGGATYSWVDIRHPNTVLGTEAELKVPVTIPTTFRVTNENGDYVELTVNVKKNKLEYIDQLEGRKVRKGRTVVVHNEEITIQVHDKNEIDGDSIALYYGDSLIVEHVALTKKKQSFKLKIDKENPTQLILYAENLGSVPPNTAALTIKDGKETTDIVLGSDFKFCDSIMLQYKEE